MYSLGHICRKQIILLSLLLLVLLSGCSRAEAGAKMLHSFGITSDEEYQAYISLAENGQLDEDGNYASEELDGAQEFLPPDGSVHVTFAENAYISVQYYLDSGLTKPVDPQRCYLTPGDCLYAQTPDCEHPYSQWYKFDCFCIYACDENGKRIKELSWTDEADPALVLRIPEEPAVSEVSVVPMGQYEKRTLELTDYYIDSAGAQKELDGTWIVNDEEVSTRRTEVSPVESLFIDYRYDETVYDFVASSPSSFYHEKGLVRFELTDASEDISQYSVELRELAGSFAFDPDEYPASHGTVTFSYNGLAIDGVTYIDDGGIIHYTATAQDGYLHPSGEGYIIVDASNPDKMDEKIRESITFYPDEEVTVNLLQPETGGSIEYFADGKKLSGQTCTLRCGTVITMEFDHWNGWVVDANAGKQYTVTEAKNQTVSITGSDISRLFRESDDHKPTLNIVVKDSMKSAIFEVVASENGKKNLSYAAGSKNSIIPDLLGQNDREIFGGEKVGTGRDVVLSVTDDTIFAGYAMKLEIETKDIKGNEKKLIQYVTDLPAEIPVGLYGESRPAASTAVYENITVKVSKVEVSTYTVRKIDHATVSVRLADESDLLQNGDVLEASREVEITITPDEGYYIEGSKLNSGVYSDKMKYSKWEKDAEKTLEKHPAQKLWYVTLDTSDAYGTCAYTLDGKAVSGKIGIRKGQKLTLVYTLTDTNYQISRKGINGILGGIVKSSVENKTIPVSEALDGKTIRRSEYITVERKGG